MDLLLISGEFSICRLAATEELPGWATSPVFSSITRTRDELSILCPAGQVPAHIKQEAGWRVLKFPGPFAFTETGILASVLTPLATEKIGILAIATFDTDYLLVKAADLERARHALKAAGHTIQ